MEIQLFNSPQFGEIRTAGTQDAPLFCLSDICKAVELTNPSSVKARLDPEDVQLIDLHTLNYNEGRLGTNPVANFVTESGFYDVLLQSTSAKVKPFRKWITSEVLPSIRKAGVYATDNFIEKSIASPEYAIRVLTALKEQRELNKALVQENETKQALLDEQKPKVLFADAVATAKHSCLIGDLAKIIKQNGIEMGQNRMFTWLRDNGYLGKTGQY